MPSELFASALRPLKDMSGLVYAFAKRDLHHGTGIVSSTHDKRSLSDTEVSYMHPPIDQCYCEILWGAPEPCLST